MKIFLLLPVLVLLFSSCASSRKDTRNKILVSVADQELLLTRDGKPVKSYPVSTSKFGLGSKAGSNRTPLGNHEIAKKIGGRAPSGAVFKSRVRTGEILKPNAKGRDPIVSRIMWLAGKDSYNRNTFSRYIYIHGTPVEYKIGQPASYGCIRMKSRDIIDLYNKVGEGAGVKIIRHSLSTTPEGRKYNGASLSKKPYSLANL